MVRVGGVAAQDVVAERGGGVRLPHLEEVEAAPAQGVGVGDAVGPIDVDRLPPQRVDLADLHPPREGAEREAALSRRARARDPGLDQP